jgi:CO/xanthine dehydrogenase FAD-binding subunit
MCRASLSISSASPSFAPTSSRQTPPFASARVPSSPISSSTSSIRERFPALVEAGLVLGSIQIRNRATLAGNLCNASPAADTAPALLVYGARVTMVGNRGTRELPLDEFLTGPGRTALGSDELVAAIDLQWPPEGSGAAFARLTRRRGVDLAIVSVACLASRSGENPVRVWRRRTTAVRCRPE